MVRCLTFQLLGCGFSQTVQRNFATRLDGLISYLLLHWADDVFAFLPFLKYQLRVAVVSLFQSAAKFQDKRFYPKSSKDCIGTYLAMYCFLATDGFSVAC